MKGPTGAVVFVCDAPLPMTATRTVADVKLHGRWGPVPEARPGVGAHSPIASNSLGSSRLLSTGCSENNWGPAATVSSTPPPRRKMARGEVNFNGNRSPSSRRVGPDDVDGMRAKPYFLR